MSVSETGHAPARPSARQALTARLMQPGFWMLQGRKVWERVRFRLGALARPAATWRRHRALAGKTVVVYTMGKVGSSSVYYTLMKSFPFRHIYHNHFLSRHWLEERLPGTPFTRNIALARQALAAIARPGGEVLYVCMMRDPVARDLSNVIQNYVENGIDIMGEPFEAVLERIRADGHQFHDEWFETDFANYFGRPVTDFPFDPEQGYTISRIDGRTRLLLFTVEGMDRVFDRSMAELLGVDIDPQYLFNETSKKVEAAFYARLKAEYRLDAEHLDRVYGTSSVRHFYTPDQIARFRDRWGA